MPKQYVFIDRKKVSGCDDLDFKNSRDVMLRLPVGSFKTFYDAGRDSPEFAELDRDPNYRKIILDS